MNPRLVALCCVLLVSCGSCGDHVAELELRSGRVERDSSAQRGQFVEAAVGDRFVVGDGLRTGPDSLARLALVPEGVALVEENTLIRFFADDATARSDRIQLEQGIVQIDAAPLDLEVHTPRAIAKLSRGGKLRITSRDGEERFDVLVGRVAIEHDGERREVDVGQAFAIAALPEPARSDEAATAKLPEHVQDAPVMPEPRSSTSSAAPVRRTPDLALPAENATLHAPDLPLEVRVRVPPCEEPAVVEVEGPKRERTQAPEGATELEVPLGAGVHRVRVRCRDAVVSETSVRVQRDAATLELPRTAPRIEVDADGRRYTVQYQNVLPVVSLTWRDARPARAYTLTVQKGTREQRYQLTRPQKELRSGELGEGEHRFSFATDGGQRSRDGLVRIQFDASARAAYLEEPAQGTRRTGGSVVVAGGALLRSEVSVAGQVLPLDAQGRFRAEVPLSPDQRSVVVRVRHPATGVHYYLRRVE